MPDGAYHGETAAALRKYTAEERYKHMEVRVKHIH
jgi:hypothetical protein